ncbi:thioredoxin 1 [Pelomyxa schiedti]|nr:thioredoxin 1 [Pelomyxa schiedti]
MGTFCAAWLYLTTSDQLIVSLNPYTGATLADYSGQAVVDFNRTAFLNYEAMLFDSNKPSLGCLAPVFGLNETTESDNQAPVKYLAMCTASSLGCAVEGAVEDYACLTRWRDRTIQSGVTPTQDNIDTAKEILDAVTAPFPIDTDPVILSWINVDDAIKSQEITTIVIFAAVDPLNARPQGRLHGNYSSSSQLIEIICDYFTPIIPCNQNTQVHFVSSARLEGYVATHGAVVIDFHATWCGPCKRIAPYVHQKSHDTGVAVARVDVDEQDAIAQEFAVQAMPTFVVVKRTLANRLKTLTGASERVVDDCFSTAVANKN